jgi:ABC-type lipoprotein export system ATPase subunit
MTITLENLRPPFLGEEALARSEVWNRPLVLRPGEKIRVSAPSGTGKTLLIRILYGLQRGYGGVLSLFERDVRSYREKELAALRRRKISIVFQNLRLFPHLTARENIDVKACLTGGPDEDRVRNQAERLGIEKTLERRCSVLSLGERQRIAILRALAQPFDWLLLDEPFSHLDRKRARTAAALIEETCAERNAGFLVTSLGDAPILAADRELQL